MAARVHLLNGDHTWNHRHRHQTRRRNASRIGLGARRWFDVDFAPIFERLYSTLFRALGQIGIEAGGQHCAMYELRDDGRIDVIATTPVADSVGTSDLIGVEVIDLAAVERAATLVQPVTGPTVM